MRSKNDKTAEDLRIDKHMQDFGFKADAATSTGRALILNLVRSAYGPEAAREFMRQMNLEKNRGLEAHVVMDEFRKNQERKAAQIEGVGTEEEQLCLFDLSNDRNGTFLQKKSRRA